MASSYIIAARRTPIGKLLGQLSSIPAPKLGAVALQAAIADSGVGLDQIDEVILGNVLQAGVGQAPARQAALAAGIPAAVPAVTINKVCGSGLKAVMLADQAIRVGDAQIIAAGGMESMSLAPHLLMGARGGWKFGNQTTLDAMLHDGLWCATEQRAMGCLADDTATGASVSRAAQDAFALASQQRALKSQEEGLFRAEIVPMTVKAGKVEIVVDRDEGPRAGVTLSDLTKLRPSFGNEGSATAGNASQISDGAAALMVVSEAIAKASTSSLRARIVATASTARAPKDLFLAPIAAIRSVLEKAQLTLADIDLVELNEAFASQCLACLQELKLSPEKTNVRGGAIALGHPIGCSGARALVTLLHALQQRGERRGIASLCLGGGGAVALLVELEK
ncbi:Acetyl-CoA acetyltransferase [Anatilimnocola aggregata]|uniref:Acetyl-CoA acetyltransferase n=1 Tax=Anatilimnocola aggregata TaxID=2528021 RepID=A0A517YH27_9BACT|nr:acetyl-CoA C-acyltransferase [Anatilimnocola aggregata]QDU29519.1 Acetyl-CoA acetyltransferase [Anatilimnocola aggregata]